MSSKASGSPSSRHAGTPPSTSRERRYRATRRMVRNRTPLLHPKDPRPLCSNAPTLSMVGCKQEAPFVSSPTSEWIVRRRWLNPLACILVSSNSRSRRSLSSSDRC
jgi:hypothetical protein